MHKLMSWEPGLRVRSGMVGTVPADAQSVGTVALSQVEDLHLLVRARLGRNLRNLIDIVVTLVAECRGAGPAHGWEGRPLGGFSNAA
ncbi:MAG: hypothetical protein NVS2B15_16440 [Pseudarthrobacter sp.]